MINRPWTVVTYNSKTSVTKVTDMLQSSYPNNAKIDIEARLAPEVHVIAIVPGHHADWSKGWWVPSEPGPLLNCS
jgi:hypothetical protein